jgi:hypothetical protein
MNQLLSVHETEAAVICIQAIHISGTLLDDHHAAIAVGSIVKVRFNQLPVNLTTLYYIPLF